MRKPPPKHSAEASMALRGPTRSSHLPNTAAERPSSTMAMEKITASCPGVQSSAAGLSTLPLMRAPMGFLNTLKA